MADYYVLKVGEEYVQCLWGMELVKGEMNATWFIDREDAYDAALLWGLTNYTIEPVEQLHLERY